MTGATREALRLKVIEALVAGAKQPLGRTAVMKCLYFLQEARGVPLGYRFTLYTYGPFAPEVLGDLAHAEAKGRVRAEAVTFRSGSRGYQYRAATKRGASAAAASDYRADLEWVVAEFAGRSASDLETASTLYFVDRDLARTGRASDLTAVASRVHDIKPHLRREAIEREARRLKSLGLLRAA
jgi:uncharacterized protein YwgA